MAILTGWKGVKAMKGKVQEEFHGEERVAGLPLPRLSNSTSQHCFLVHLAGGRLTNLGEGAVGGAWCEVDGGCLG
jgi:hypothetical protein